MMWYKWHQYVWTLFRSTAEFYLLAYSFCKNSILFIWLSTEITFKNRHWWSLGTLHINFRQENASVLSLLLRFNTIILVYEPGTEFRTRLHVRPAKTQISLRIRGEWPVFACHSVDINEPKRIQADNKNSGQSVRMSRLIWVFSGSTCIM